MTVAPPDNLATMVETLRSPQGFATGRANGDPYEDLARSDRSFHWISDSPDPLKRMFGTRTGQTAVSIVGNEKKTLNILNAISTDILLEILDGQHFFGNRGFWRRKRIQDTDLRPIVVPGSESAPSALVILDPKRSYEMSKNITGDIHFSRSELTRASENILMPYTQQLDGDDASAINVASFLLSGHQNGVTEALLITQPDISVSRRPRMVPLCAPSPNIEVQFGGQKSTAGVFCRDAHGALGVTACFHGTGPVGTKVQVGLQNSSVTIANNVQDLVFIPLNPGYNIPSLHGAAGVLNGRTPGQYESVEFDGATSGRVKTHVTSYDAGLLRSRATVQLRVQTPADTNSGDSGSALVNQDDKVVGFAFERSAFGEIPEMTDWIWAANAMKALNLSAI
jgi:hypothetical protein